MTKRVLNGVLILFGLSTLPLVAGEDVCDWYAKDVVGKKFVAKQPLYDTKVAAGGIVKLERDREEIGKGRTFRIVKVTCSSSKIKLKAREENAYKAEAVSVYLLFKGAERVADDAKDTLAQITDHIYEEADGD